MSNKWVEHCVRELMALKGRTIEKALILEMAFIEADRNGKPVFEHPACPFLQASILYLIFTHGETIKILTYQNDDSWGLYLSPLNNESELNVEREHYPIFRLWEVTEFPKGTILDVSIAQNEAGDIAEMTLVIGQQSILLMAGEVYEHVDETIRVVRNDESVFVFLNPHDVERVTFYP